MASLSQVPPQVSQVKLGKFPDYMVYIYSPHTLFSVPHPDLCSCLLHSQTCQRKVRCARSIVLLHMKISVDILLSNYRQTFQLRPVFTITHFACQYTATRNTQVFSLALFCLCRQTPARVTSADFITGLIGSTLALLSVLKNKQQLWLLMVSVCCIYAAAQQKQKDVSKNVIGDEFAFETNLREGGGKNCFLCVKVLVT